MQISDHDHHPISMPPTSQTALTAASRVRCAPARRALWRSIHFVALGVAALSHPSGAAAQIVVEAPRAEALGPSPREPAIGTPPRDATVVDTPRSGMAGAAPRLLDDAARFVLPNGLTVVVHEDRKLPVVAVEVRYRVGSANEPDGLHGFAHLFEHLLFRGSAHVPGPYRDAAHAVGASRANAGTIFDATQTYQEVPTSSLEAILFLESDRMGHLAAALTDSSFEAERGIVMNELRQRYDQPYSAVGPERFAGLFPKGHPYSHMPIGSLEDLERATIEDAREWFETYYGPSNAILSLAGDIDEAQARILAERYFGDLAPRPAPAHPGRALPHRTQSTSTVVTERVPTGMINRGWALPPAADRDVTILSLAADLLEDPKGPFVRSLTGPDGPATRVQILLEEFRPVSIFDITLRLKEGVDPVVASARLDEALRAFVEQGPSDAELRAAASKKSARFVRLTQRVLYQAIYMSAGELSAGDPRFLDRQLEWIAAATPDEVRDAVSRWLGDGWHQVVIQPAGELQTVSAGLDRSLGVPSIDAALPDIVLPGLTRTTVAGGAHLVVAPRPSIALADLWLVLPAGYSADAPHKRGLSKLAAELLGEASVRSTAAVVERELTRLGATVRVDADLETLVMRVEAPPDALRPALELLAELALEPRIDPERFETARDGQRADAEREMGVPFWAAVTLAARSLYGPDAAYGIPWSGSGTPESVAGLTVSDLEEFHATWFRPDHAVFLATGAVDPETVRAAVEHAFGAWERPPTPLPGKLPGSEVDIRARRGEVLLIDQPGAAQSLIFLARLAPSADPGREASLAIARDLLVSEGIERNLRVQKGWSYGFGGQVASTRGPRLFYIRGSVQVDRTGASLAEVQEEMRRAHAGDGLDQESVRARAALRVRTTIPNLQSNAGLLSNMSFSLSQGLPADDLLDWKERTERADESTVRREAAALFDPDDWLWIVVGDADTVAGQLRDAGFAITKESAPR